MEAALDLAPSTFTQEDLVALALSQGHQLQHLTIKLERDNYRPELDFSKVVLPRLRSLCLDSVPLVSLILNARNMPKLESLSIRNSAGSLANFSLDLPYLRTISLDFLTLEDAKDFGPSLSRCTRLQSFVAYKLWGLGGQYHFLNLPSCTDLSLYRSDDIKSLDIYAPKLTSLDLQACYSLIRVKVHCRPMDVSKIRSFLVRANQIDREQRDEVRIDTELDALVNSMSEEGTYSSEISESSSTSTDPDDSLNSSPPATHHRPPASSRPMLAPLQTTMLSDPKPQLVVNLLNAVPHVRSLEHLRSHPRIGVSNIQGLGASEESYYTPTSSAYIEDPPSAFDRNIRQMMISSGGVLRESMPPMLTPRASSGIKALSPATSSISVG